MTAVPPGWLIASTRDLLRVRLQYAFVEAVNPRVRCELRWALRELERVPEARLSRCAWCGQVGLPERIASHDCETPNQ
jgi:hypothetical protein